MKRKELEFVLESKHYLKGGTKEACVKARDFLGDLINLENQIHVPLSCVKADEFVEAVRVLIAFAFRQEDTIPETWKCDSDCRMSSYFICPGECNIREDAEKICPFFMDEGLT